MDIELLRTFLEVVRVRHFGKAAGELCVTQSAVSARIRQLEQTLGMPLFSRHRNNIQLTPAGQQLRKHAETIVQAWARARQETGLGAEVTGGLAIGAMWDLWEIMPVEWLHTLRNEMADTALQVDSGTADLLLRKLVDGVIDLALLFEPPQLPEFEIRELGIINLHLVATSHGLTVAQAFESGYIMVDWGTAFAHAHARHFPDMPSPVLRMNLGALARRYLQHGEGAAYLPEQVLSPAGDRHLYRVKDAPLIERPAFAIFRSGTDRDNTIRKALALLNWDR
ncbi:MAG: LysR family transcriptional regulator [Gammaproteobacteria bacterium]